MFDKLVDKCLHIPDKIVQQNEEITEMEKNKVKTIILRLLGKNDEHINNLDNPWLRHLIKATVFAYRRPQCIKTIEYLIKKMEKKINPQYFPAYNFVFMKATSNFGLFKDSQMDVISQLIFKKHENVLTDMEKQKCVSFLVLIREIYAISQIIQTDLNFRGLPHIINLYNIIDKFNDLFRVLFGTKIFDIYRTLKPHKYARNSIAHAHFVINYPKNAEIIPKNEIVEITPKMVIWNYDRIRKEYFVVGYFEDYYDISLEDIRRDLVCLSVFICQYLLFFQYLNQIL